VCVASGEVGFGLGVEVISELIAFEFLMRLRYGQRDVHIAPNYTAEPEPRTHSVLLDSQVWMWMWMVGYGRPSTLWGNLIMEITVMAGEQISL